MTRLWWNKKWGSDKLCGITHTRLRPGCNKYGIKYTTKLKCNHTFYTNPLIEWIKNCPVEIPTCPTCRKDFKIEDLLM